MLTCSSKEELQDLHRARLGVQECFMEQMFYARAADVVAATDCLLSKLEPMSACEGESEVDQHARSALRLAMSFGHGIMSKELSLVRHRCGAGSE